MMARARNLPHERLKQEYWEFSRTASAHAHRVLDMMMHTFNLNMWEVEAGESL